MSSQMAGLTLLAVAGWLLWSPWAFAVAGVLLLVVPEAVAWRGRPR